MRQYRTWPRMVAAAVTLASIVSLSPAGSASADTVIGADGFGRVVAGGLGTADAGGAWTLGGTASSFSVGSGVAALSNTRGKTLSGYLTATPTRDTDVTTTVRFGALPVGGPVYAGVVGRRIGTHDYSSYAVVSPTGALQLSLQRDGQSITGSPVIASSVVAGTLVHLRMQTAGAGPTTLRVRAWLDGAAEPATWAATTTDATAANQGAGSVGIRAYLSSSATNDPIVYRFDDFAAAALGTAPPPPRPTQSQWLADVATAMSGANAYLDGQSGVTRPAIVLDIDNTSLQSYYQTGAATPPVLSFAQRAVADGYAVLVATGRSADSGGTLRQLQNAGYQVDALCFRDPGVATTQISKTNCRNAWAAAGYTIVANAGNHTSDLDGGNSGRQYLLPNYGFLD